MSLALIRVRSSAMRLRFQTKVSDCEDARRSTPSAVNGREGVRGVKGATWHQQRRRRALPAEHSPHAGDGWAVKRGPLGPAHFPRPPFLEAWRRYLRKQGLLCLALRIGVRGDGKRVALMSTHPIEQALRRGLLRQGTRRRLRSAWRGTVGSSRGRCCARRRAACCLRRHLDGPHVRRVVASRKGRDGRLEACFV